MAHSETKCCFDKVTNTKMFYLFIFKWLGGVSFVCKQLQILTFFNVLLLRKKCRHRLVMKQVQLTGLRNLIQIYD